MGQMTLLVYHGQKKGEKRNKEREREGQQCDVFRHNPIFKDVCVEQENVCFYCRCNNNSMSAVRPSARKSLRNQDSSDGTSSAYDALRFLRTTNKWGKTNSNLNTNDRPILRLSSKIEIFFHRFVHHVSRITMISNKFFKIFIMKSSI